MKRETKARPDLHPHLQKEDLLVCPVYLAKKEIRAYLAQVGFLVWMARVETKATSAPLACLALEDLLEKSNYSFKISFTPFTHISKKQG